MCHLKIRAMTVSFPKKIVMFIDHGPKIFVAIKLGIPIDRVPTSKSYVFCLGTKFLFVFPFDRFLVPSCCKDYFLEKFSDSVWWLYKPAM